MHARVEGQRRAVHQQLQAVRAREQMAGEERAHVAGGPGDENLHAGSEVPRNELRPTSHLDGAEVPQIERRNGLRAPALGDGHDDRVHEPELQASIARRQLACATEICGGAPLHGEASGRKIIDERLLDALSQLRRGEVIDLGKDRPWKQPDLGAFLVQGAQRVVMRVVGVKERDDGAGIGDDHRDRPIPLSSSSARSLSFAPPLRPAPRLRGAG